VNGVINAYTIYVRPNVYTPNSSLSLSNTSWFFEEGSIVNNTVTTTALFNFTASENVKVWGRGTFNGFIVDTTASANPSLYFEALSVTCTTGVAINITLGNATIDIKQTVSGLPALNVSGGTVYAKANIFQGQTTSDAITQSGGTLNLTADLVQGGSGNASSLNGGNGLNISGGLNTIVNAKKIAGSPAQSAATSGVAGGLGGNGILASGGIINVIANSISGAAGGDGAASTTATLSGGNGGNGGSALLVTGNAIIKVNAVEMVGGAAGAGGVGNNSSGAVGTTAGGAGGVSAVIFINGNCTITVDSKVMTSNSGGFGGNGGNNSSSTTTDASNGGVGGISAVIYTITTSLLTVNGNSMKSGNGGNGGNGGNISVNTGATQFSGVGGVGGVSAVVYSNSSANIVATSAFASSGSGGSAGTNGTVSNTNNVSKNAVAGGVSSIIYSSGAGPIIANFTNSVVGNGGVGGMGGSSTATVATRGNGGAGGDSIAVNVLISNTVIIFNGELVTSGNGGNGGAGGNAVGNAGGNGGAGGNVNIINNSTSSSIYYRFNQSKCISTVGSGGAGGTGTSSGITGAAGSLYVIITGSGLIEYMGNDSTCLQFCNVQGGFLDIICNMITVTNAVLTPLLVTSTGVLIGKIEYLSISSTVITDGMNLSGTRLDINRYDFSASTATTTTNGINLLSNNEIKINEYNNTSSSTLNFGITNTSGTQDVEVNKYTTTNTSGAFIQNISAGSMNFKGNDITVFQFCTVSNGTLDLFCNVITCLSSLSTPILVTSTGSIIGNIGYLNVNSNNTITTGMSLVSANLIIGRYDFTTTQLIFAIQATGTAPSVVVVDCGTLNVVTNGHGIGDLGSNSQAVDFKANRVALLASTNTTGYVAKVASITLDFMANMTQCNSFCSTSSTSTVNLNCDFINIGPPTAQTQDPIIMAGSSVINGFINYILISTTSTSVTNGMNLTAARLKIGRYDVSLAAASTNCIILNGNNTLKINEFNNTSTSTTNFGITDTAGKQDIEVNKYTTTNTSGAFIQNASTGTVNFKGNDINVAQFCTVSNGTVNLSCDVITATSTTTTPVLVSSSGVLTGKMNYLNISNGTITTGIAIIAGDLFINRFDYTSTVSTARAIEITSTGTLVDIKMNDFNVNSATGTPYGVYCVTNGTVFSIDINKASTAIAASTLLLMDGAATTTAVALRQCTFTFVYAFLAGKLTYIHTSNVVIAGKYVTTSYNTNTAVTSAQGQSIIYYDGGVNASPLLPTRMNVVIDQIDVSGNSNTQTTYIIQVDGNDTGNIGINPPLTVYTNGGTSNITVLNEVRTHIKNINLIPTVTSGTATYRNDVGILFNKGPFTIHECNVDYAFIASAATATVVAYLSPPFWIVDAPGVSNLSNNTAFNFGLMIRSKRISAPAGKLPASFSGSESAMIFFDNTVTTVPQTTLIEGEYIVNSLGTYTSPNNISVITMNTTGTAVTGPLFVKNIVTINKASGTGSIAFRSTTVGFPVTAYSYWLANVGLNNVTLTSYTGGTVATAGAGSNGAIH
jgi:hypothetical protein